jgi:MarR family transcriptional regulator, 2-MHQ and catechol-resistance regulon repressor
MSARTPVDAPRLWLVLARCHRALNQIAERSIEETGLGLTDFAALEALLHKGPLTITEIHGKVPLALGSMTAAVDRLEKKGLIIRTVAPEDRRAKLLKLTAQGNQSEKRELHGLLKKLGLFAAGTPAESDQTEISA